MHRSKSTRVLLAVGLTGLMAADVSVALAQEETDSQEMPLEARPGDAVIQCPIDQVGLDTSAKQHLDQMATWLREDSNRVLIIQARPDHPGMEVDTQTAMDFSDRAKVYLRSAGIPDEQIRVVETGSTDTPGPNERMLYILMVPDADSATATMAPSEPAPADDTFEATAPIEGNVEQGDVNVDVDVVPEAEPAPAPILAPSPMAAEPPPAPERDGHLLTPMGMGLAVGGGVVGFVDEDATQFTDVGGSWEARLTVGTRFPLAFEAGYIGSAQNVEALGLDTDAVLLGTALEGNARLNLLTGLPVQPYVFGGIGWTHYDVVNSDFNTSSVDENENLGHIPLGAGFGFGFSGLLIDVRGTFRAAFNDDLRAQDATLPDDSAAELDSWNVAGKVGWEF